MNVSINLEPHFTLRTEGRTQDSRWGTFLTVSHWGDCQHPLFKTRCLSVTSLSKKSEFCNSDTWKHAAGHTNLSWRCLRYDALPQTTARAETGLPAREGESRIFFVFFFSATSWLLCRITPHHLCQHLARHVWLTVRDLARWHFFISSKPLKAS